MATAREWIKADETANEMLGRVLSQRPLLLFPPLHRVPLRAGNVVEIVGPSHSAKTHILLQAAITCILPKDWNGVHYGGLELSVMFFDLDCRFDIMRLSQLLKYRLIEAYRVQTNAILQQNVVEVSDCKSKDACNEYDEELYAECLKRFFYIRCYDSFEFLASLKSLRCKLEKARTTHAPGAHLLMIDSIGAFYWIDRSLSSLPQGAPNRKNLSLQIVSESVVQEIKKLLLIHPMLVFVTKRANLGDKYARNQVRRWFSRTALEETKAKSSLADVSYREYMPSIWQSIITHRVLVRASDDERKLQTEAGYLSEWLSPALKLSDKFIVTDAGIVTLS